MQLIRLTHSLAAAVLVALLTATSALAQDISVRHSWSRATPKGAQVAGAYLMIENGGMMPDKLLEASTPAARKIEIHRMSVADGVMTMRPVEGGLTIPPEGMVTLAPGGDHLMLIGLAAPLDEGMRIPVSLFFERAGMIEATFEVGSVGAKGPRPEIAAASQASAARTPALKSDTDEPFFTHICGTRVMANVTVSPGKRGPVEVLVQLEDTDEKPLAAEALSVTLSNHETGVAPLTAEAERVSGDSWRVLMAAEASGKWSLSLGIALGKNDRVDMAAPILIE